MKIKKLLLGAAILVAPFLWANSAHAMTQSVTQPRADMVDVSSNNDYVSVSDYQQMKSQGVKAVVVKATEGDWYKNPYAKSQAQNADKAGLALNFYHFSHLTSAQDAINEANYFANYVKSITSDKHVVMVNDSESTALYYTFAQNNLFNDIFYKQLNKLGYCSTDLYTSESWNNYHFSTNSANKGWIAGYPSIPTGTRNSTNNSWQWGSDFQFWNMLGRNFDVSQNYNDKYYHIGTSNASSPAQAIHNGTATATTDKLNAGDIVYIKTAANKYYGSNATIPKFAKNKNYHVLSASGNRVVIKEIMSAVNRTDVVKVSTTTTSTPTVNSTGTFKDGNYTINRENGTFTANQTLRVFAYPGVQPTGDHYYAGESVKYDGYIVRNGYVYISYVNYAGYHHYIAVRENGVPLGTFR